MRFPPVRHRDCEPEAEHSRFPGAMTAPRVAMTGALSACSSLGFSNRTRKIAVGHRRMQRQHSAPVLLTSNPERAELLKAIGAQNGNAFVSEVEIRELIHTHPGC